MNTIDELKKEACQKCGECCQSVGIWYEYGNLTDDQIRWHLYHGAKIIYAEKTKLWGAEYPNKCIHLSDTKTCLIFDTRPEICRMRGKVPDDLRGCVGIKRFNALEEIKLWVGKQQR